MCIRDSIVCSHPWWKRCRQDAQARIDAKSVSKRKEHSLWWHNDTLAWSAGDKSCARFSASSVCELRWSMCILPYPARDGEFRRMSSYTWQSHVDDSAPVLSMIRRWLVGTIAIHIELFRARSRTTGLFRFPFLSAESLVVWRRPPGDNGLFQWIPLRTLHLVRDAVTEL